MHQSLVNYTVDTSSNLVLLLLTCMAVGGDVCPSITQRNCSCARSRTVIEQSATTTRSFRPLLLTLLTAVIARCENLNASTGLLVWWTQKTLTSSFNVYRTHDWENPLQMSSYLAQDTTSPLCRSRAVSRCQGRCTVSHAPRAYCTVCARLEFSRSTFQSEKVWSATASKCTNCFTTIVKVP